MCNQFNTNEPVIIIGFGKNLGFYFNKHFKTIKRVRAHFIC